METIVLFLKEFMLVGPILILKPIYLGIFYSSPVIIWQFTRHYRIHRAENRYRALRFQRQKMLQLTKERPTEDSIYNEKVRKIKRKRKLLFRLACRRVASLLGGAVAEV